ncbi:sulfate permease [Prevotella copri]|jgi:sulfate permease, SulP family|uniref:SulP family inorganic anion transporter n=1 Tax=Segatella TaxID=2974251 RepID=UPI00033B1371|nr:MULTISPECIES: sulfate permease [Prevotellaceae]MBD9073238.1 sulfate permease [Prevotella sp.]CDC24250.1 sulfate permease [Prevotella sp. CAG:386]MBD9260209.1 sulfate permease [Prevotella sp.]MBV3412839.1 sulfate permease [Segatella copri]MDF4241340.1 sulfate permease [Prevotella sp. B2-R-102]
MKAFNIQTKLFSCLKTYDKKTFMSDLMAGIIVGIVALPLAIAFGIASGVTPEKGIITAIVAGLVISLFGGSKVQIGGPTGAFIIIIYGIIQKYGFEGLTIATLMAGFFLVLFGLLRLGTIIKYIPYPIVVGFTSGIAVTIFTTQIKDLFGLTLPSNPSDFIEKWGVYLQNFNTIDPWCALIGVASVVVIAVTPRFSKKIPGSLIAIILMTIVALLLKNFAGVLSIETIGDRFSISNELPAAQVPDMNWETIKSLVSPAITIAILGAIESLLSATVADGVIGDHHDSNTELVAQGLANIASPLFGGIPATGAIARTMTNINNGGKTPVAGIIHAVVLLLIFLFLMPLAKYIPMACLAGVLVVVSYGMCGWRSFLELMKNPKSDVTVLLITFFLTIIFDLTIAIEVGLIIACLLFMKRMSETTDVKAITEEIDLNQDAEFSTGNLDHLIIPQGVEVYEINGPYFFGAGNKFEEIMASFGDRPKVRIIRMRKVPFVDSTGIHNLTNLCEMSKKEGIQIVLSGVREKVNGQLEHAGFYHLIGEENICSHINLALKRANEIIEK